PRERVRCGDFDIWVYDSLIAGPFNLFLRSMLASRCRAELATVGPDRPHRLSRQGVNFSHTESSSWIALGPEGEIKATFATPVRGGLIDIGAEYDGHYHVTFYRGEESLGTAYVPRANFPLVSSPLRQPGIQSRLVTVPPVARRRGWTTVTIHGA